MTSEIAGVIEYSVMLFADERGVVHKICHPFFSVKDVYVTTVRQGAIKAWHGYRTKSIYWTVVQGFVKLALYDNRFASLTYKQSETIFIGAGNPVSVLVPPGVYSGFKGITEGESVIVVQADEEFSEDGMIRVPYNQFDYSWGIKHG